MRTQKHSDAYNALVVLNNLTWERNGKVLFVDIVEKNNEGSVYEENLGQHTETIPMQRRKRKATVK